MNDRYAPISIEPADIINKFKKKKRERERTDEIRQNSLSKYKN